MTASAPLAPTYRETCYWLEGTEVPRPSEGAALPVEADVVVVGGGYTGVTAAGEFPTVNTSGSYTRSRSPGGGSGKSRENGGKGGTGRLAEPPAAPRSTPSRGGVLGEHVSLTPNAKKLPFLVLGLVGLAIILLALGAVPRSLVPVPAAGALVARHRLELATAGIGVLVASLIAYLIA